MLGYCKVRAENQLKYIHQMYWYLERKHILAIFSTFYSPTLTHRTALDIFSAHAVPLLKN